MRKDVLFFLKDHEGFISGEDIASKLNISRASIWKHIHELREQGYEIEAVPHLGYRLVSIPDKLYPWEISYRLKTSFLGKHYFYFDEVTSTMEEAFQYALEQSPEGTVVVAEQQKKGRGRFNRAWISPRDKGIYFSFILRPKLSPQEVSKITLLCSIGCVRALSAITGLQCAVKWPNDILVNNKKICGILTELNADQDTVHFVTVGIGINVHTAAQHLPSGATSIFLETGKKILRADLLKKTLEEIESCYRSFLRDGFDTLREEWRSHCSLWGKQIKVHLLNSTIEGQAIDIDAQGCLLIRNNFGLIEKVTSGDVATLEK